MATADLVPSLAGVDLGSNSFHMVVARVVQGQLHVVDRMRDRVQLALGLDGRRNLTTDAQARAIACLERFGQRVRGFPPGMVRAVGTNTLRQAKDARAFLDRAQVALGHTIEVISGREEARLIYLGVAHDLSDDAGRRLVVDIGGGSTECIVGERFEALQTESLYMGCVSYSQRYFPSGKIRREDFRAAEIAAQLELQSIQRRYRSIGWDQAIGASGTIVSVDQVLRANGWGDKGITVKGLKRLRKALIGIGSADQLKMPGLPTDRAAVFPGGVAILLAVFESLGIEHMTSAMGALREGLLYDLLGRIRHEDVRDQTIRALSERYHVDVEQAGRVERTGLNLLEQAASGWELPSGAWRQFLSWGARLHEIGLSIAHTGYHKHSAYLIENADMAGFSREDQRLLAVLVRNHRRKISKESFRFLPEKLIKPALRLCVLLRLAVSLNRSRSPEVLPRVHLWVRGSNLQLSFPAGWFDEHPLTRGDLDEEAQRLAAAGLTLELAA